MTSSNCAPIRPRLVAHVKGELPPLEATLVDTHLQRCEECSAVVDTLHKGFAAAAFDHHEHTDPGRLVALVRQKQRRVWPVIAGAVGVGAAAAVAVIAVSTSFGAPATMATATTTTTTTAPVVVVAPPVEPAPVVD